MTWITEDVKLDFKDVLIRPQSSLIASRADVSLIRKFKFPHSGKKFKGVPIIAANMDNVGTMTMAREFAKHQMSVALHKHYPAEDLINFFKSLKKKDHFTAAYSMGISQADLEKFEKVKKVLGPALDFVCVDVANGYSEVFRRYIEKLRSKHKDLVIMAGNVVTNEMTQELIWCGVDIVKVGIGSGSVCTTRKKTGVGYPQLSAIMECADAAHNIGGLICSDGGCTSPGDVAKAFGAGADFVMLGGMLAAHNESEGEVEIVDGKEMLKFYGMSSAEAMKKHSGGVANYRASEGKVVLLPSRGPVEETIKDILGGVRSACTYIGARKLKEVQDRTTFVRVTQQLNESLGRS